MRCLKCDNSATEKCEDCKGNFCDDHGKFLSGGTFLCRDCFESHLKGNRSEEVDDEFYEEELTEEEEEGWTDNIIRSFDN